MFFRRIFPDNLVIAAAETHYLTYNRAEKQEWYHAFLCLVEESKTAFRGDRVKEQLHISSTKHGNRFSTHIKWGMTDKDFRKTSIFPLIGGKRKTIKQDWKDLTKFFERVTEKPIEFEAGFRHSPTKQNCRTAVRDALATKNIILHPEYTKSDAGLYAPPLLSTV